VSLALREEHRLRVFLNRVPRRIFGHKRKEVTTGWKKLYTVELHNSYSMSYVISVRKSKGMRWVKCIAHMGEIINAYKIVIGKSEETSWET
jgi:hypothetical protein